MARKATVGETVPQHSCRVAVHQPNYAPWIGYFAKMAFADTFVFLDNCQMPAGRSYVSRVKIGGRDGAQWMTVPVRRTRGQAINLVRFADSDWPRKHMGKLRANYGRTPFFESVMESMRPLYESPGEYLAPFNMRLIRALAAYVGLSPRFYLASELAPKTTGTQRLIDIARALGGTTYVSGSGAVDYLDPAAFKAAGVKLDLRFYQSVPYRQQRGDFVAGLSMLDAVFHLGPGARALLSYPPLMLGSPDATAHEEMPSAGSLDEYLTDLSDNASVST